MPNGNTEVVHIPEIIEVIPAGEIARFREDLATMEKFYQDLEPIYTEAKKLRDLPMWDKNQRIRAGELVTEYKRIAKDSEDTIERYKKAVNRFKEEYISKPEKRVANRAEEIKAILTPKMGEWDRAELEAKQAEERREKQRIRAELDRQAELKRQADDAAAKELREKKVAEIRADLKAKRITKREAEKRLRAAGAMEEALKAQAAADEEDAKALAKQTASTVKVESQVPSVHGNVKRVNYSAECTDKTMFLKNFAQAAPGSETWIRLIAMIEVSDQKLSAEAKEKIKTSPEDRNHELTVDDFEKLYPWVKVKENRSY